MQLALNTKTTRVINSTAVGITNVVGTTLDMQDFEGVMFVAQIGTVTDGTPSIKAGGGAISTGSDAADLAGTNTGPAATHSALVLDIYRPTQRYITPTIVRGGATGSIIDSVIAIQYGSRTKPTINDPATVAATEAWVSPLAGTA